jgi:hypothetical protein
MTTSPTPRRRGRPPSCSRELALRVVVLRDRGLTLMQICIALNARGIPTPTGRPQWRKAHVDRLLHTQHVRDLIAQLEPRRFRE